MSPIIAQAGITHVELRPRCYGEWDVLVNGEPDGSAWLTQAGGHIATARGVTVTSHWIERAAVDLAVKLDDAYWTWRANIRAATVWDLGRASGAVA